MKTIIIIPTYNERENIKKLIPTIFSQGIFNLEIMVVDDNSPDGTALEIKKMAERFPLHLIERSGKFGLGSAYVQGFKKALQLQADFIIQMDADFSHDPADLKRLISTMEKSDVVIGSRRIPGGKIIGWNAWRHFTSWSAMNFCRLILKLKTRDVTAGFRCYRRAVIEKILAEKITSNGYAFQEEMLFWIEKNNFRVTEIPVTFVDRKVGISKLGAKDVREFFQTMWRLRKID